MVGRSRSITGPYVDKAATPMLKGGGSPLLNANARWLGPGGESILMRRGAPDLIVFHAYDAKTGKPSMQLSTLAWHDGWPAAALGN
jgi:arabinan endo-1,5-alpha-L-arabinosidase